MWWEICSRLSMQVERASSSLGGPQRIGWGLDDRRDERGDTTDWKNRRKLETISSRRNGSGITKFRW